MTWEFSCILLARKGVAAATAMMTTLFLFTWLPQSSVLSFQQVCVCVFWQNEILIEPHSDPSFSQTKGEIWVCSRNFKLIHLAHFATINQGLSQRYRPDLQANTFLIKNILIPTKLLLQENVKPRGTQQHPSDTSLSDTATMSLLLVSGQLIYKDYLYCWVLKVTYLEKCS